ncbi:MULTISPECIES: hypothetical protein [Aeromonas]|nr:MULTISPECIES: hypothetical protein [Aeromonas]AUZ76809.1 hypothetical protein C2U40_19535 [Aeromonas sp. ASNIH4]
MISGVEEKSSGEQALFIIPGIIKIDRQLTGNILLGENKNARIFFTSTKGNLFEALAIIEVEKQPNKS